MAKKNKAYFTKDLFQNVHRNVEGMPEKCKKGKLVWVAKYRENFSSVKTL